MFFSISKMNLKLCLLAVLMVSALFVCAEETDQITMVEILKRILKDPEYMALGSYQKVQF